MWRSTCLESSSMELNHFCKHDNSAMTNDWSEWWVRAWEAPLVSLSGFIIISVSRFIMVTALWAVSLSFLFALMQFFLLYYYEDMLMHVLYHVSYHVLYIMQYTSTRNSKLSLLSAGGTSHWERSACDLCVTLGGDSWHIPTSCISLGGWSTTVINLAGHWLQWWH